MATLNITGTVHAQLAALTVDIVRPVPPEDCSVFWVTNRDAVNELFVRLDGQNPSVNGEQSLMILPRERRRLVVPDPQTPELRLIAGAILSYSVECDPIG